MVANAMCQKDRKTWHLLYHDEIGKSERYCLISVSAIVDVIERPFCFPFSWKHVCNDINGHVFVTCSLLVQYVWILRLSWLTQGVRVQATLQRMGSRAGGIS
jgi:hypothetical protein